MAINMKQYKDKLLSISLCGSNEIGINVNLCHYKGKTHTPHLTLTQK